MRNTFKALCLTHHQASLQVREQFALSEQESKDFLLYLKDVLSISEALVVSTCNRTEIYYCHETNLNSLVLQALAAFKGNLDLQVHLFDHLDAEEAVMHLFEVSLGLDAQILGDIQVFNQIKRAYQWSVDMQMAEAFLHRLLHSIFFTHKKVSQETSFRDGAASISYAAVELLQEITFGNENPNILVLGVGEIGADVCRNLKDKFVSVSIINRNKEKSIILAEECDFKVLDFENVWEAIEEADVVISSLSVANFIHKEFLVSNSSSKYFIDLSVPRSVHPNTEEVLGSLVYDIEHLEAKTHATFARRQAEIPAVKALIREAMTHFEDWTKEMEVSPTIQKLKNALEQIRREEIARHHKKMSEEEMKVIEQVTENIIQKILKTPVLQLKAACKRGEADTLIDVLNDLFNLEKIENIQ